MMRLALGSTALTLALAALKVLPPLIALTVRI